jgi:hypothetical protein
MTPNQVEKLDNLMVANTALRKKNLKLREALAKINSMTCVDYKHIYDVAQKALVV